MVSELFVLSLSAVAFSPTGNVIAVFCIQLDLAAYYIVNSRPAGCPTVISPS